MPGFDRQRRLSCAVTLITLGALACGDATPPVRSDSTPASIVVTGAPSSVILDGTTAQLVATPLNATGGVISSIAVTWSSSDDAIASVSSAGVVLATGAGTATITASAGAAHGSTAVNTAAGGSLGNQGGTLNMLNGEVKLSVPPGVLSVPITIVLQRIATPPVNHNMVRGTSFHLDPEGLAFGGSATLTVRYDPAGMPSGAAERSLQLYTWDGGAWTSVPQSTVDVDANTVTAPIAAAGLFEIAQTVVDHLTIDASAGATALYVGQRFQLPLGVFDASGHPLTGRAVSWSTSNGGVASVDNDGFVTGKSSGTATITATSEGKSVSVSLTIIPTVTADWSGVAGDWTTFQNDTVHRGYVAAVVNPGAFKERWAIPAGGGNTTVNAVTFAPGTVFASTSGYFQDASLSALDLATGAQRWTVGVGKNQATMAPAYANGTVYLQTNDIASYLWGIDAATGGTKFRVQYASQWSKYFAPVIVGQTVYMGCGTYDGLCAMRASDGGSLWFASTNQYDGWSPTYANGVVYTYTGDQSPKVQAIDAATGTTSFEIAYPGFNWNGWTMNVAPILGASADLIATQNGRLVSFDLVGRRLGWQQKAAFAGQPALADGVIYVFNGSQVEARKEVDGTALWTWAWPVSGSGRTLIATRNLLFVSTDTRTYAVDLASHKMVWSYALGGSITLSSQGVLVISGAANLAAITVK